MAKRILLVDDSHDSRVMTSALLALCSCEVLIAHNGQEALEIAQQYQPDFILLDIRMPGMNGYEVAAELRKTFPPHKMQIIALSGYPEDRALLLEAGFDSYLPKPIAIGALRRVLDC